MFMMFDGKCKSFLKQKLTPQQNSSCVWTEKIFPTEAFSSSRENKSCICYQCLFAFCFLLYDLVCQDGLPSAVTCFVCGSFVYRYFLQICLYSSGVWLPLFLCCDPPFFRRKCHRRRGKQGGVLVKFKNCMTSPGSLGLQWAVTFS